MQTTQHILMIRPVNFLFNSQTAVNNAFQVASVNEKVQQMALTEFDEFVEKLRLAKINVIVIDDTPEPHTPDSIFPNNWISFHSDGTVILYPMFAENRRLERKQGVLDLVQSRFNISTTIDLTEYEKQETFLEGTGSVVLDREKKIAYACVSPRTDENLFRRFCREMNYEPVLFHAIDNNNRAIYHTNVMMCVADKYVVICLNSIRHQFERKKVVDNIKRSGKEIIEISYDQVNQFAGNMLQVNNQDGTKYLVMSSQAYNSLSSPQVMKLKSFNEIIHSSLNTIERNGGGSARCMMAEIHLPSK
jgi:hypothetical protein